MLQPLYTMNGFNWFDKRGVEGVGFVRALRTLLTNNLPQLLPDLGALTRSRWTQLLSDKGSIDGETQFSLQSSYPEPMRKQAKRLRTETTFGLRRRWNHSRCDVPYDDGLGGTLERTLSLWGRSKQVAPPPPKHLELLIHPTSCNQPV